MTMMAWHTHSPSLSKTQTNNKPQSGRCAAWFGLVCRSFCLSILLVSWSFASCLLFLFMPHNPTLLTVKPYSIHRLFCLQTCLILFSPRPPFLHCPLSHFPLPFIFLSLPLSLLPLCLLQRLRRCIREEKLLGPLCYVPMFYLAYTTVANCPILPSLILLFSLFSWCFSKSSTI